MTLNPANDLFEQPTYGLIGHRGVAALAPENTLSGLLLAKKLGLNWVEIDVRRTRNGDLVIFHDPTLERTTNGQGELASYDLVGLKQLDAGYWFSPSFTGEKIMSLAEALIQINALNLSVNLEIKCPKNTSKQALNQFAHDVHNTISMFWPKEKTLPLVSSFNLGFIRSYRALSPHGPVGVLTERLSNEVLQLVKSIPNCTLHCGKTHLAPEQVLSLSKQGIKMLIYTVNEKDLGIAFLKAGAFGLFVDTPSNFL